MPSRSKTANVAISKVCESLAKAEHCITPICDVRIYIKLRPNRYFMSQFYSFDEWQKTAHKLELLRQIEMARFGIKCSLQRQTIAVINKN